MFLWQLCFLKAFFIESAVLCVVLFVEEATSPAWVLFVEEATLLAWNSFGNGFEFRYLVFAQGIRLGYNVPRR